MPLVYRYSDYRVFLRDFYKEKKSSSPSFSYQVIANKTGFKSKSFFPQVLQGKRNLSEESIFALKKILNLNEKEFSYFKTMIAFNQAQDHERKNHFYKKLLELNIHVDSKLIMETKHAFYSQWYHNTIRELISFFDFKEDYVILGKTVKPAISPSQAKDSVDLLLKLGLIAKTKNGYIQTDPDITTGDTVTSLAVETFHIQNLKLAAESIKSYSADERDVSCIVAGLSEEGVRIIKEELRFFRKRLIALMNQHKKADRVYHLNMQLFPTTETTDLKSFS